MLRIAVDPAQLRAGELAITGDEHHYIARVRRSVVGDALELFDGAGQSARAQILAITDAATTLRVEPPVALPAPVPHVHALLPLIKGERMDIALEKLVEVGVDAITVWPAQRSVVKLTADKRDARIDKFRLAVHAAARQSGRAQLPTVAWAESIARAQLADGATRLVLDPYSTLPLADALPADAQAVVLVSGPEGGLAPEEHAQLAAFTAVSLGQRVLRAETAPVAAVAVIRAITRS